MEVSHTSDTFNATFRHSSNTACTSEGIFLEGNVSLLLGNLDLTGSAMGVQRCGTDLQHLGRFQLTFTASKLDVALSDTLSLSINETRVAIKGLVPPGSVGESGWEDLDWVGHVEGEATLSYNDSSRGGPDDAVLQSLSIKTTVPFSRNSSGSFVVDVEGVEVGTVRGGTQADA